VGLGGTGVGVSGSITGVGLGGMEVGVSVSTWGVGLGGMKVGVARPARGVGLGGTGVETVVGLVVGRPQLVKSRAQITNVMKIDWDSDRKVRRLGAIEHLSFPIHQASIEFVWK